MRRRGQLFLIEVIISLSVLLILVTTLFSTQTFTQPVDTSDLYTRGENAMTTLIDSGYLESYFYGANWSYYFKLGEITEQPPFLYENDNITKSRVIDTIESSIPSIANYKAHTERYNPVDGVWDDIDTINYFASLPQGYNIVVLEYYCPGILGVYDQYKFRLYMWYEVEI
ncbi:MAG: hypothetical protein INQ03_08545 [Candidatus Heimdallarchaeota archaeon]|nr:hypothetical protein [Candidatus Heimdallarchaeota archaeon]